MAFTRLLVGGLFIGFFVAMLFLIGQGLLMLSVPLFHAYIVFFICIILFLWLLSLYPDKK